LLRCALIFHNYLTDYDTSEMIVPFYRISRNADLFRLPVTLFLYRLILCQYVKELFSVEQSQSISFFLYFILYVRIIFYLILVVVGCGVVPSRYAAHSNSPSPDNMEPMIISAIPMKIKYQRCSTIPDIRLIAPKIINAIVIAFCKFIRLFIMRRVEVCILRSIYVLDS